MAQLEIAGFRLQSYQRLHEEPKENAALCSENSRMSVVQDELMNMATSAVMPGLPISHAHLTERLEGPNIRTVSVRTIDSLMEEYQMPGPYLLKIDVDGVELLIMEGAKETFKDVNVVVVEAGLRNYFARAKFLEDNGFELFDIVDPCYYDNRLRQFDMIFINSRMADALGLDMQKQPFEIEKWVSYK